MRRALIGLISAVLLSASAGMAAAQSYPSRSIRIVTTQPGSGIDLMARLVAQALSEEWNQPVLVDDRGGADGIIAAQDVAKSAPDGYTLLAYGNGLWLAPFMHKEAPYDPVKDFAPITLAARTPLILVANSAVPAKSIKELIALAKDKPGQINYGSGGLGGSSHLSAELFNSMAGVKIGRVPYKSSGLALNAVLSGEVQMMFADAPASTPLIESGKVRGLGISGSEPSKALPDLPTIASAGVPGYESETLHAFFAPAKTPPEIVDKLNKAIVQILNRPDVQQKLVPFGVNIVGSTPDQLKVTMAEDMARFGKLINDLGIREK